MVDDDPRLVPARVEDAEPAVVAGVDEVAVERQVGVRDAVLVGIAHQLQVAGAGGLLLDGLGLRATLRQLLAYVGLPGYVYLAGFIRMCPGECRERGERVEAGRRRTSPATARSLR
jgi:hypothetical protein